MRSTITVMTQKIKEGRPFSGRSFRIFVFFILLLICLFAPTIKAHAMADIGGESIYELFGDKGDDVFSDAEHIVKDITAQIYQLVKYIAVFVLVVSIIIAAVGITSKRAENRERSKTKLALTVLGGVFMFASIGVLSFSQYIAGGISTGIIRSEYEQALSDIKTADIAAMDYQAIRAACYDLVNLKPELAPLKPYSSGYYKRNEIKKWLTEAKIIRSSMNPGSVVIANAYGEACILLYTEKHHVLKDSGEPYYDYTYNSSDNTLTGTRFIIDFNNKSIREK